MPKAHVAPASLRPGQGQPHLPKDHAPHADSLKVRATAVCYYDDKRRRIGDVFTLLDPKHFSETYMERVDPATPDHITTGQEVLRQEHDAIVGATVKTRVSDSTPLGDA